jgi:hypothetical protein
MVSMSSEVKGPSTKRARVILVWKGMGWFLRLLPLIAIALLLQDLKAADLFGGDVCPGNTEVRRVELQFQEPFKEAAGVGVRPRVIEIVEFAVRAAVDSELPAATLRAGAGSVGVAHSAREAALSTSDIVGVGAAARTVRTAVAQLAGPHRTIDQQPERDRRGPLVRC